MKKNSSQKVVTLILSLLLVFSIGGVVAIPQVAHADTTIGDIFDCVTSPIDCGLRNLTIWLMQGVLNLCSLFAGLAGVLLNGIIHYTVVEISNNYGRIPAINNAWDSIRDLANMSFIFILLYAAIKTILGAGSDTKKLVVNIIIVAILINFSLFFTKVIIDASNVLALFFYDAAAPGALAAANPWTQGGISNSFMANLHLASLYKASEVTISSIFTIGVLGSIMLIIAGFVFFSVAFMFITRYVVLILVLILSPIAFMASVLPALRGASGKWWDALVGQAFFAPIYFMITWIALSVLTDISTALGISVDGSLGDLSNVGIVVTAQDGTFALFMNFMVVIVFLLASLAIAKSWANRAGSGSTKLTKWVTGAAGAATFGMAGRLGRNLIGGNAAKMATDEDRIRKASEGNIRARLELATANKLSRSSFDARGTTLGGIMDAGKVKKGANFIDEQKARIKTYEKYKPSSSLIKSAQTSETAARKRLDEAVAEQREKATNTIPRPEGLIRAERELDEAKKAASELSRPLDINSVIPSESEMAIQKAKSEAAINLAQGRVKEEKERYERNVNEVVKTATKEERGDYAKKITSRRELERRMENMARRAEKQFSVLGKIGITASSQAKADAIRAAAKSKTAINKASEALKDLQDEGVLPKEEAQKTETPPASNENKNEGESKTA